MSVQSISFSDQFFDQTTASIVVVAFSQAEVAPTSLKFASTVYSQIKNLVRRKGLLHSSWYQSINHVGQFYFHFSLFFKYKTTWEACKIVAQDGFFGCFASMFRNIPKPVKEFSKSEPPWYYKQAIVIEKQPIRYYAARRFFENPHKLYNANCQSSSRHTLAHRASD